VRAFVIVLEGLPYSEAVSARCIQSARTVGEIEVLRFPAIDRTRAEDEMKRHGLKWTWAKNNTEHDTCPRTGLKQHPYGNLQAKIGCSLSHYLLWQKCAEFGEPFLILEHDVVFVRTFPQFEFHGICQINDPKGATPRGDWWHDEMKKRGPGVFPKTHVFDDDIPDGLAGNSAYVVKPFAARELILAFHALGVWPNDAMMCRQMFPYLQEYFPFVTRVEQSQSTTS
jgi:GR25 family glycosyltransferase involved in LPS biosynthesis